MNKDELLRLYNLPLDELLKISAMYIKDGVEFCSLINARNGKCSQNCKYCAQSSHYNTEIESFPLVDIKQVTEAAKDAIKHKASRFAIVTSGKTPDESDFDRMLEMIEEINKFPELKSCYGMELCCGVILGMGESVEQRVEMALTLAEIQPDSIPINILMPIANTPFENYLDKIDEENVLRTLAIFKIANPKAILRFCGGRMRLSLENQEKALQSCVEGIMVGNYLTTVGRKPEEDIETVERIGKKIICSTTSKEN